ncbi:MAG: glycerol kinase GlpK [Acidobacteria bacterium]|nr:glycerol kinase GlpK [Acidobacteriota bacterium]
MSEGILVIDQGTTGSRAIVYDRDGYILGRAYREIVPSYPRPGWVEQDPEEIWRTSLDVMREALEKAPVGLGELRGIGITNQRETTVVWDRQTGLPAHPAIVWQSRQSAGVCERLRADGIEPMIRERTGLMADPYFSGSKLRWLFENDPEVEERATAGELLFGTVDSWLLYRLTGGKVHATDPTNASRTLLFDIRNHRWDPELLGVFGVPESMLPEVHPSSGIFGLTEPRGNLPGDVPVAGIAGDQQAALFGQGCWEPGTIKNTYGTGCFTMLNTGSTAQWSSHGLLTTLACDAGGGSAYALEGSVFVAGAAIGWLRDELKLIGSAAETGEIAARTPDTGGVYVVPAFTGLGAPYWDMHARGAIVGLTRGSGRNEIVRATLESIAFQTRDVIDAMQKDAPVPVRELRADGGASSNDFLMQFQADILGIPVVRPGIVETTAAGAAFLAGLATGFWSSIEELKGFSRDDRIFTPAMSPSERERRCAGWREAVSRVLTSDPEGS